MKIFITGLLAFSIGGLAVNQYWLMKKPSYPLRAIQATCTKTNDCTIYLYQNVPDIVSVPSGKDQTPEKAKIVITRN